MTTSQELRKQYVQIKKDAAASVREILGERESVDVEIEVNTDTYVRKVYRENDKVFVDVIEPNMYDTQRMETYRYWIRRMKTIDIIRILEELELESA